MAFLGDLPPPPRRYSRPRAAQVGCVIGALAAAAAVTHPATWAADGRTDRDGHVRSNEILVTSKEAEGEREMFLF